MGFTHVKYQLTLLMTVFWAFNYIFNFKLIFVKEINQCIKNKYILMLFWARLIHLIKF